MAKRAVGRRKAGTGSSSASARLRALEAQVEQNRRELELQFRRIAQMQGELDYVKQAWSRMKSQSRG
jgi:predicted transposase YdaD